MPGREQAPRKVPGEDDREEPHCSGSPGHGVHWKR